MGGTVIGISRPGKSYEQRAVPDLEKAANKEMLQTCKGLRTMSCSRPGKSYEQTDAYKCHIHNRSLKEHTFTVPDGLIIHSYGPIQVLIRPHLSINT